MSPSQSGIKISKIWWLAFVAILPISFIWALSNPMFASPDEPAHMVRAQGVIRGDFSEPYLTDGIPTEAVTCMNFKPDVTADCMDLVWSDPNVPRFSPTDTYPPLFHLLAGIPSLVVHGLGGAYVMRLWLAVLCSAGFALAASILFQRSPSRWTILSVAMTLTPMVVFTSATVNPSGITAALSSVLWASGISLIRPGVKTQPSLVRGAFLGSAIVFPLLRRDALAWELIVFIVLIGYGNRERFAELRRDRTVVVSLIATFALMLVTWFAWSSTASDSFVSNSASHGGGSWHSSIGNVYTYFLQMIGWFGWLDSPMSSEMFVLLLSTLAIFITLAVTTDTNPERRTTGMLLVALFLVPILIGAIRYPYLQGRYLFPIFTGLCLIAGQALAGTATTLVPQVRTIRILASLLAISHFFAFAQNLRRYAVGRTGSWDFWREAAWSPPMFTNSIALFLAFSSIVWAACISGRLIRATK